MTNAHVIGSAKKLIISNSGIEFQAETFFINETRDIALLKSNVNFSDPIDISLEKPNRRLATPISESLKTTVTKGIIT